MSKCDCEQVEGREILWHERCQTCQADLCSWCYSVHVLGHFKEDE